MPVQLQSHRTSNAKLFSATKGKKLHSAASLQLTQKTTNFKVRSRSALVKRLLDDPTSATFNVSTSSSSYDNMMMDIDVPVLGMGGSEQGIGSTGSLRRAYGSEGNLLPGRMNASERVSSVRRNAVIPAPVQPIKRNRPSLQRQKSSSESNLRDLMRPTNHKQRQQSLKGGGSSHSQKKKKSISPMRRTKSSMTADSYHASNHKNSSSTQHHNMIFLDECLAPVVRNGKSA